MIGSESINGVSRKNFGRRSEFFFVHKNYDSDLEIDGKSKNFDVPPNTLSFQSEKKLTVTVILGHFLVRAPVRRNIFQHY